MNSKVFLESFGLCIASAFYFLIYFTSLFLVYHGFRSLVFMDFASLYKLFLHFLTLFSSFLLVFHLVITLLVLLFACLFSRERERREGMELEGWNDAENLGGDKGVEAVIRI